MSIIDKILKKRNEYIKKKFCFSLDYYPKKIQLGINQYNELQEYVREQKYNVNIDSYLRKGIILNMEVLLIHKKNYMRCLPIYRYRHLPEQPKQLETIY